MPVSGNDAHTLITGPANRCFELAHLHRSLV